MKILPLPSDPRYRVSDTGDVYGQDGRKLKPWIQNGYYRLYIGGRKRYVHDLVLETHDGPKPPSSCVRHGRKGSLVNAIGNICYGTYSENEYDKVRDGTHQQASKTHCTKRGHLLSGDNVYMTKAGGRQCRQCVRDNQRIRRAARRVA